MEIHFSKDYTGDNRKKYNFPSDDLPKKLKQQPDYFLKAGQAIISKYCSNHCAIPYDNWQDRESLNELRRYSEGKNGAEKYKDTLIGKKDKTGKRRRNTWNINWTGLKYLPKKIADVLAYLSKIDYEIIASAIDLQSTIDREILIAAAKLSTDDRIRNMPSELNELAGGTAINPEGQLVNQLTKMPFSDESQVEMAESVGVFMLSQEEAMEILLKDTRHKSNSQVLDKMIRRDLIDWNIAARFSYSVDSDVLDDHIDVRNLVIPYSEYPDFRDATYFGIIKKVSIAELVRTGNFTNDQIIEIARKYNTTASNRYTGLTNFDYELRQAEEDGLGINVLHSIKVDVAYCYWIGNKNLKQTRIVREKDGCLNINNVDDGYELSDNAKRKGKKLDDYTWQTVYKAKMIIGTDYVYEYGEEDNIEYRRNEKGQQCAKLPVSVYQIPGPSLVARCKGFDDDAHLALYKKRMIIKNLITGPGIKVNKSAFDNVIIDKKKYSPLELMSLYKDEGVLIVDDKNAWGNNTNSGSRPLDVIPSDVMQRVVALQNEIDKNLQMIDIVTGINQSFSGVQPAAETGLGVMKMTLNQTENSVFQIVDAFEELTNHSDNIKANKWKIICAHMKDSDRESYNTRAKRWVKLGKEIPWSEFGIKLQLGFTENEKLQLMQRATQLADFRRQSGTGGIKPSDELMVFEMIKQGNIKQARLYLSQVEELRAKEEEQKADKRYQENAALQQQSNDQAAKNRQSEIAAEGEVEIAKAREKFKFDLVLQQQKAEDERRQSAVNNVWGWNGDLYKQKVR